MPINTASLKTFAPAMRRQLIEAVGRKLDRLLTSTTPDTLTTYATQIAELRQQEADQPAGAAGAGGLQLVQPLGGAALSRCQGAGIRSAPRC